MIAPISIDSILSLRNRAFVKMGLAYLFSLSVILLLVPLAPKLVPLALILVCSALVVLDQKGILIVLYVVSITTNGYILKEDYLLGAGGPIQVFSLFALYSLSRIKVGYQKGRFAKIATQILWLVVAYQTYTGFKNAFFGLHDQSFSNAVLRGVNALIMYVPLVVLISKSASRQVRTWMVTGLFLGCLNMAFFCFISPALPDLGFYSIGVETAGLEGIESNSRHDGVMGNGDSNSLGVLFTMAIGFFLARQKALANSMLIKFLVLLMVIGVALTGSRTAFISLGFVVVAYLMSRGQSKLKVQTILFGLFFVMVSEPLWETVIMRMADADGQLQTDTSSNRVGKWILYFSHILREPVTLLIGTPRTLFIGYNSSFHQAHNVIITMIYNSGLFFTVYLIWKFLQIAKAVLKNSTTHSLLFIFIPFLAIITFVSDMGSFVYFSAFLSLYMVKEFSEDSQLLSSNVQPK